MLNERGELGREVGVEVARELTADNGTITIERAAVLRAGRAGDVLKNDRAQGLRTELWEASPK